MLPRVCTSTCDTSVRVFSFFFVELVEVTLFEPSGAVLVALAWSRNIT